MNAETVYDCIVVGAGPGGLQAAIYLGRYNRKVLLIDRGGGRTTCAKHIENYLGIPQISGREIVRIGKQQAESFGVEVVKGTVSRIEKKGTFEVTAGDRVARGTFVVVSTGGTENLPAIENIYTYFATSVITCIDCDGYHTTGKKLVVIGDSAKSVDLALAMQELFTRDITLVLLADHALADHKALLRDAGIELVVGKPKRFVGGQALEGLEMEDGRTIPCEVVYAHFGFALNDACLAGLPLERSATGKYVVNRHFESTLDGLYLVGPLVGSDQVVVAAGEGALAALDMKKRLIEMLG
jgi:thioredoxin reductase (NADPH)